MGRKPGVLPTASWNTHRFTCGTQGDLQCVTGYLQCESHIIYSSNGYPSSRTFSLQKPLDHKYRYFRRVPVQEADHSFHVGLQLCSSGHQRFNKLIWIHHSCHITYKATGETAVSAFEIDKMYTPLLFARVRSYTAFSERPL